MMQMLSSISDIDNIIVIKYVALLIATYYILKHTILRSKLPPSPFLSFPIVGHLYLFKKPLHRSLARAAARYGPIVYLKFGSRPVVLVSSPSIVEECLVRSDVFVNRPNLIPGKYNGNNFTTIAWAPYGVHWKNLRKIAAVEILSPKRLQILSEIRANVARSFVRRMMKLQSSSEDGVVEMRSVLFGLTLDNMMKLVMGKSNFEEEGEGTNCFRRFEELVKESFNRSGVSNIEDFLPIIKWLRVFWGSNNEIALKMITKENHEVMKAMLKEHRKMEKERRLSEDQKRSMLHVLLSLQKEDPKYYTDELIRSFILGLFQAGTDTSASTLVWALSLLLNNNSKILKKAQLEIDSIVGYKRLVEESDKNNLPYIQCIVNETMRMYPTAPLGLPRESIDNSRVGGYFIPKGSMLVYNIWALHNDPSIWDEPRKFKPERFVGVDGNRLGCKFIPFGTGKRVCPGEHMAGKVIWLAIATMIQCFEWERVGEDDLVDMKETGGVSMTKLHPLLVKCRPRTCLMDLLSLL